ncbi:uncharacterized protein LOC128987330 isoform X1 [Macrosteles quadrilineatus]|uniref:uncharacterized protein LOC128987330 isoform X1 n=2 Tax=Macrosteles quadrilineatus TaxID=74068 RepID=UPI0023E0ECDE|nr:uncharacterized protein LOC128987330 isoform X1 [Macrosteles quadrilineatus]
MIIEEIHDDMRTAIEYGRTDIVKTILDSCSKSSSVESEAEKGKLLDELVLDEGSFLCFAAKLNRTDIVRTLLAAGADPSVRNQENLNALELASSEQTKHTFVEELLRAIANSQLERVYQLVKAGVDVNTWDSDATRNTPLHWAACYADSQVVAYLIEQGADMNAVNSWGATPLHEAIDRGEAEVIAELLCGGPDLGIRATRGKHIGTTPLDMLHNRPQLATLLDNNNYGPSEAMPMVNLKKHTRPARSISVDSYHMRNKTDHITNGHHEKQQQIAPLDHSLNHASSLDLSPKLEQVIENLVRTHISTPVRPLVTNPSLHLLWPQPHHMLELAGPPFVPDPQLQISVVQSSTNVHEILNVWEIHRSQLLKLGLDVRVKDVQPSCGRPVSSQVTCVVNPQLFSHQHAYQIHISTDKVQISADSVTGLHYAVCTFTQLLQLAQAQDSLDLVPVLIQDHPAMKHRAVLLDIAPLSRVPTLDYLFEMIDKWSSLKISHLHLYTRLVSSREWQLCYKQSDMVMIDRYCHDRFISLLPVLDIDNSVQRHDLDEMWPVFQDIVASFTNLKYVHLGPRLSSLLICGGEEGADVSLQDIWHHLSLSPDVTVMLCSNTLHNLHLAKVYVPANIVLMDYGFQADYDFADWTQEFHQYGCTTCLCPGTASWNSLAGCPEASICNIYRAVQAVQNTGALGTVVAHWSGSYHITHYPFSWPGFMVGAGLAWNTNTHWDYLHNSLADLLDTHVFGDRSHCVGQAVLELGHAETYLVRSARGQQSHNVSDLPSHLGSILYQLLVDPDNVTLDKLTLDHFSKATKHIKRSQTCLMKARPDCSETVLQELNLTVDLMLTACKIGRSLVAAGVNPNSNMGLAVINLGVCHLPPTFRTDVANKLLALIEQYKGAWLQRHLPAGLQNSLLVLTSALRRFVPEDPS